MPVNPNDTAMLLQAISGGDANARKDLFSVLYNELHALAHAALRHERSDCMLQTTALIHETYLKLVPQERSRWQDKKHFFSVAGHAMRRILVSEARRRNADKRGGGWKPQSLDSIENSPDAPSHRKRMTFDELELLDEALEKLQQQPELERMCVVVDLLFFVGMTQDETAEVLNISKTTVRRDWDFAKVWLQQAIRDGKDA